MIEQINDDLGGSTSTEWVFVYLVPGRIIIGKKWILRKGKTGAPGEKPQEAREKTNNRLNLYMVSMPDICTWDTFSGGRRMLSPPRQPLFSQFRLSHSVKLVSIR